MLSPRLSNLPLLQTLSHCTYWSPLPEEDTQHTMKLLPTLDRDQVEPTQTQNNKL